MSLEIFCSQFFKIAKFKWHFNATDLQVIV